MNAKDEFKHNDIEEQLEKLKDKNVKLKEKIEEKKIKLEKLQFKIDSLERIKKKVNTHYEVKIDSIDNSSSTELVREFEDIFTINNLK